MLTDPVLTELWIVALCCIVNRTNAWPIHADVVSVVEVATRCRRACIPSA